jgi:hypothetical protein
LTSREWSAAISSGRADGFGALVHALVASIDLSADPAAVQAAASVHGRIVGATAQEISAAIATVGRVLKHPILRGGERRE